MKAVTRAVAALSVVVTGCGASSPSAHAPVSTRPVEPTADSAVLVPATARRDDPCNVRSGEVRVGAQILDRGAALVFTTADDVHNLRQHVAESKVLAPDGTRPPRLDNVRGGVRLVFDAETAGDQAVVQRVVREHAREIAKTCGMVLAAPGESTAERGREESSPEAAVPVSPAPKEEPRESAADRSGSATPSGEAAAKPEPKPAKEPKPESEPSAPDKPKDDKPPKEDEKPPIRRLPDQPADPITPDT